jgi:hypothetical protein
MRCSTLAGAAIALCLALSPATAGLLTEADYAYLAAQQVPKTSPVLQGLSPKEQSRLGSVINDSRTAHDPAARARSVQELLAEFEDNQRWERMNPGQLWDQPRRRAPRGSIVN